MGPGPDQFVLSRRAGEQLGRQVRYVERLPRNRQPHRRRSVSRGGGTSIAIATLGATLNHGGSVTATFTVGGSGTTTVYDALLCSGDSILSGSTVVIAQIAGKWYVIQATCPCT